MLVGLVGDLRLALRRLLKSPLYASVTVLSIGLAIGVTVAVYSVVRGTFFRELGVVEPHRLIYVTASDGSRQAVASIRPDDLEVIRGSVGAVGRPSASRGVQATGRMPFGTDALHGDAVDADYFSVVGVPAMLGRMIRHWDDRHAARVVVLSHWLWQERFASRSDVIGKVVYLSDEPFEVIGVAPASFQGLSGAAWPTRFWVPLATWMRDETARRPLESIVARLKPLATVEAAAAELRAIGARLDTARPELSQSRRGRAWGARTVADVYSAGDLLRRFGWGINVLLCLVFLVACTNLANLVLARGLARRSEVAVRRSIGASRWRLVRAQLAETAILVAAGGAFSFVVFAVVQEKLHLDLPLVRGLTVFVEPRFGSGVVATSLAALLVALAVFGLEPALRLTGRRDIRFELAGGSGLGSVAGASRQRVLLRWQIVVSTCFLLLAALCVRYTSRASRHDSGVSFEHLAVAQVSFTDERWDAARIGSAADHLLETVRTLAGIDNAALSTGLPFGTPGLPQPVRLRAFSSTGAVERPAIAVAASSEFFRTVGVPVLRGTAWQDRTENGASRVAVLSERTAASLFGDAGAIGRELHVVRQGCQTDCDSVVTVVGIARNTDVGGLFVDRGDVVYVPLETRDLRAFTVLLRASDPAAAVHLLRFAIRQSEPAAVVSLCGTGAELFGGELALLRAAAWLASGLGLLTLLLASVGLYAVQSQIVSQRTREFGIRLALGATPANVSRSILRDGCRPVLEGFVLGLPLGALGQHLLTRLLAGHAGQVPAVLRLLGEQPLDPWAIALVPVPLVVSAWAASYLPARRASCVDPISALRAE